MNLNRREFIRLMGLAGAAGILPRTGFAAADEIIEQLILYQSCYADDALSVRGPLALRLIGAFAIWPEIAILRILSGIISITRGPPASCWLLVRQDDGVSL